VTPVEFRGDLWHQKTRVPGVSCGVVCVILHFAVLVELRLVTDGHRQTDTGPWLVYRGCIASRGNKLIVLFIILFGTLSFSMARSLDLRLKRSLVRLPAVSVS